MPNEHGIGVGVVTTVIMVWALVKFRRRDAIALVGLVTLLTLLLTTFFFGRYSLWRAVAFFMPGAMALRAVSRIGLLLSIPAGVGVALYSDWARAEGVWLVGVAVALFCCVEQKAADLSYEPQLERRWVEWIGERVDKSKEAFFVVVNGEVGRPFYGTQIDAMFVTDMRGVATINGYSGVSPPEWSKLFGESSETWRGGERFRESLNAWCKAHNLNVSDVQRIELDGETPQ